MGAGRWVHGGGAGRWGAGSPLGSFWDALRGGFWEAYGKPWKRLLGDLWEASGRLLGASGNFWELLGAADRLWELWEASGKPLGGLRKASGKPLGSTWELGFGKLAAGCSLEGGAGWHLYNSASRGCVRNVLLVLFCFKFTKFRKCVLA